MTHRVSQCDIRVTRDTLAVNSHRLRGTSTMENNHPFNSSDILILSV